MKYPGKIRIKIFIILAAAFGVLAFACQIRKEEVNSLNSNTNTDRQTYQAVGVVKAIEPESGKVTINHEDIPGYMSAMEMNEAVSDRKLLEAVKVGDKVEFEIERTGAKITITKINKIGETVNGSEVYQTNCAVCHGEGGEGAKKGIPLIAGHALHHSEAEYIEQVKNGEGQKMPAFKDKLTTEQIAAVVSFVREDLQKGARQSEKSKVATHKHD